MTGGWPRRFPPAMIGRRVGRARLLGSAVTEFIDTQAGRRFTRWSRRLDALERSSTTGKSDAALEAEIEEAGRLAELIRATPGRSRAAMLAKVQVMIRLDVAGAAWAPFLAQVERSFARRRARATMATKRTRAWR